MSAHSSGSAIGTDIDDAPSLLSRPVIETLTAFGVSTVVHCALLVAMGMMLITIQVASTLAELTVDASDEDVEIVEYLNDLIEPAEQPSDLISTAPTQLVGAFGSVVALAQASVSTPQVQTDTPTTVQVDVGLVDVIGSNGTHISRELPAGQLGDVAAHADDYAEALDRITLEILGKLERGKVLVVWVFDQSGSMKDDRDEINARLDRVYQELRTKHVAQGDALLTAVTSYGATYQNVHTKTPTANLDEIRRAIDEVPVDESGLELMCPAISFAIQTHRKFAVQGNRQLITIVLTDESGDPASNVKYLESTIAEAKAARCRVYFLGREAVFGYPYARLRWEDPGTGIPFWLPIDRGPETPLPELLQIDGLHRRWDAHGSGFGPYEQCRLARETGGVFFMLPSPETNLVGRDNRKYALEQMRAYLPDLGPRDDYIAERDKSELRRYQWKIISDLNPYDTRHTGDTRVELRHYFPLAIDQFKRAATAEQAISKRLVEYLSEAERALVTVERLRNREASPRWRANYDLMLAQVYAYQVRIYQYGLSLEAFMRNPLPIKNIYGIKRPTTGWHIHARKPIIEHPDAKIDAWLHERIRLADAQYRKVINEHIGTPYASRAQAELTRGYGIWFNEHWEGDSRLRSTIKPPKP
ncbi:MAG: VWA domain-containing protein [Planctomycetaceae bacterium]|nr:VWA domain-containing protein [Planctomycetaceae bacterium]